jgi:hypothetical protein
MKRTRLTIAAVVLALTGLGALALAATGGLGPSGASITQAQAESLALDFYRSRQAPGDSLSDVHVADTTRTSVAGRPVWRVRVDGGFTEPGSTFTSLSTMLIDVDAQDGTVTLFAAG